MCSTAKVFSTMGSCGRGMKLPIALAIILWSAATARAAATRSGTWELLVPNAGISAMHMTTTHQNTVVMFDRTDFGPSQLRLDRQRCRDDPYDRALKHDCWAHSVEYSLVTGRIRPLMLLTDTWCSSGAFAANGTLVHTGGFNDGDRAVRYFVPCPSTDGDGKANSYCDWAEPRRPNLTERRWYASDQTLPDGRIVVVGGRRAFSYEFVPERTSGEGAFALPFLARTDDTAGAENNLYPFLHLSSDGNLFIFANRDSILFDYGRHRVVREFPVMPGGGARNYPSSGSSVMLPLRAADSFRAVEILVCGGAPAGAFAAAKAGNFREALGDCGRLAITDPNPAWAMEKMPRPRVMGDMLILPNGQILIINGAEKGTAGWELARSPALAPFLYSPSAASGDRFSVLRPTSIPRLYHSTANVLPDGRILVGGSNPHVGYVLSGTAFPTELRLEAYSPYYLNSSYKTLRPAIAGILPRSVRYGSAFRVEFSVNVSLSRRDVEFNVYAPPFTTHAYSMNQRMLNLAGNFSAINEKGKLYAANVAAPPSPVAAPPGYYMLFVVNQRIPSVGAWVRFS